MPPFWPLALLSADSHPTRKAYKAMGDHYSWWIMLPHEDFSRIVDLSDQAFTLLAANCTSALHPGTLPSYPSWSSLPTWQAVYQGETTDFTPQGSPSNKSWP